MSDAESWTRRVLETEARKRGIRDPEARSRLELARLILRHDYTSTRGTRRMLGKLVGDAAAKLTTLAVERTPGATPAEERRRQTARSLERRSAADETARVVPAAQNGAAAAAAGTESTQAAPVASASALQPSAADSSSAAVPPRASATVAVTPPSAAASAAPPSAAASAAPPSTATFPAQPAAAAFPTLPAAAAFAAQPSAADSATQHFAAALSPQPSAAVFPTLPAAAAFPTLPAADAFAPQPSAASDDRLDHARHGPRSLHLRWRVSEQGADRARILLGMRGELALRIVSVRADADHVVRSEVTEHGPIDSTGEWTAQLESADTHCVSAIGLRSAGRFVSIVHCSSRPDAAAAS
jgi:hypothetical protein